MPVVYIFNIKVNILAQVFGLLGLVFVVIAYQKKEKIKFLEFCNCQFYFTIFETILLGAITGVIKNATGIIRNIVVIIYLKKNKPLPKILNYVFILIAVIPSLFFIDSWVAVLPIITGIISTAVTFNKSYKVLKIGGIFVQIISIVYSLFIGAYIGVVRQTIILIAIIIGLINYIKYEKNRYYIIG